MVRPEAVPQALASPADLARRLDSFDAATARQARRQIPAGTTRGWTRAELYETVPVADPFR